MQSQIGSTAKCLTEWFTFSLKKLFDILMVHLFREFIRFSQQYLANAKGIRPNEAPNIIVIIVNHGKYYMTDLFVQLKRRLRTHSYNVRTLVKCLACFEYIRVHVSYCSEIEISENPKRWQNSNQTLTHWIEYVIITVLILTILYCFTFCYRNSNIRFEKSILCRPWNYAIIIMNHGC